ncbi:hypothetical protein BAUCODRAFT_172263 [Baudoinia panamericana UAMH 10762]|uniref:FAD-binding domain-containing protein n=1 Tax=Baudoinia panamericana (strain UAMH 10762) TaxID=717646 RepID=M2MUD1_BAUPA|nr:uncharacterized protein BAUCODRAFT_172263 [Baudoinia panamericana UAMH 10762]EMD00517.1 hypothetical protein BAUCODRAFT_172263 [Baudoinia panamericana UAMH 10762]
MSNLKVLIVGASIAGPMAAYWFAKGGADVTIIERFPELRKGGHNIDIRTIGVTVMRRIPGMEAAVRANLAPVDGISFLRDDGKPYATIKASGDTDQQSLVSEYEIFRGDLAQILYDLTKDKVRYVFGEQIASMQHTDLGPIVVEFANGMPAQQYDLVVAADGATSRTRAMGFGCGVRDHVKRLNCWAAYYSMKQDLLGGSRIAQSCSAVGGRWLAVGPDPKKGINRVGLMLIKPQDATDRTASFRAALKQGDEELKRFVSQAFRGAGWKTDELLKAMMEADDFYASEIVQVKTPTLSKGRFVLVGDAGYGPSNFSGAGTSLAIGGAYVLAGEISKHQSDLDLGLKAYEERMRPIINDMQFIPPFVTTILAPQSAWAIWLRNTLIAFVSWAMGFSVYFLWLGKLFGGLYASSLGKDKYGLPEYEFKSGPCSIT